MAAPDLLGTVCHMEATPASMNNNTTPGSNNVNEGNNVQLACRHGIFRLMACCGIQTGRHDSNAEAFSKGSGKPTRMLIATLKPERRALFLTAPTV